MQSAAGLPACIWMEPHDEGEELQAPRAAAARAVAAVTPTATDAFGSGTSTALLQHPLEQPAMQHRSLTRYLDALMGVLSVVTQLLVWRRAATSAAGLAATGHSHQALQVGDTRGLRPCCNEAVWLFARLQQ